MTMNAKEAEVDMRKGLELGLVSDDEIRQSTRIEISRVIQRGYKQTHEQQLADLLNLVHSLRQMKIAVEMDSLNLHSYEMPASLLKYMFGSYLKDSCCYFKDESTTLDEAEIAMMDLYCERAQIKDGQRVLDLGCGWGAVTLYVAKKYKNCQVTAITNSTTQKAFIEENINSRYKHFNTRYSKSSRMHNLSNVSVVLADISTYEMEDTFDRVLVIEFLEHMKNYELLLRKISKWMTTEGLLFIQHVCYKAFADTNEPLDEEDWQSEYMFPAGTIIIPSASTLLYFQDDVSVVNHWTLSGKHYARSCEEWLKRLDTNADVIINAFNGSIEEAKKLIQYWRVYTITTTEGFGYNNGEEMMVSQLLFKTK